MLTLKVIPSSAVYKGLTRLEDCVENAGVRAATERPFNEGRLSSENLKSPQQQVLGKDEDRHGNLIRPDAGHARHALFRRRRRRYAGAAQAPRRAGHERRDGRRGRPAVRRRCEQPQRLLREGAQDLRGRHHPAHPQAALRQLLPGRRD